jgi:hypothetical protein
MKTTRVWTKLLLAALAVPAVAAVAAKAEATRTIVVMHRNIQNTQDEQMWSELARGLSSDGFRVVSVAMQRNESATDASQHLLKLLDLMGERNKVLLVGTASASDAISDVAESAPARVEALVYVSAADAVPAFGPRTVSVPANLLGLVPAYQAKVTNEKRSSSTTEGGAMVFKVREQGQSTLGRTGDMVAMIETVDALAKKQSVANAAMGTK